MDDSVQLKLNMLPIKSWYFTYQGQLFKQISGLAMGNPLAPDLSNIVLNDLLDNIIPQFPDDICFIQKYLDDLLLILNPEILSAFNSYHPCLRFTIEYEHNNALPFLDFIII